MNKAFGRDKSIGSFQHEMDRLFNDFFGYRRSSPGFEGPSATFPPLRIWEDAEQVFVEVELPGVKLEDLDIQVHDDQLVLKGQRKFEDREKAQYQRRERDFGSFMRSIKLPADIDSDKAEAKLKFGVLSLSLPKAPAAQTRRIAVTCG